MGRDRRTLLKILSGVLGGGAASIVAGPAFRAMVHPLGKVTVVGADRFLPVGRVDAIPSDGTPIKLRVVVESPLDAWQRLPPTEVGAVYVRRDREAIVAYSSICPHLGCGVDYVRERVGFACPCHESAFDLDGRVEGGPSPRPLDRLEARETEGRILVRYQRFRQGTKGRVPIS